MTTFTFKVNTTIKISGLDFTITEIRNAPNCGQQLIGTKQGDLAALAGKRSVFTSYLIPCKKGFNYDWSAR